MKTTLKVPKMSSILTDLENGEKEAEVAGEKLPDNKESFSHDDLKKIWDDYVEELKEAGKDTQVSVLSQNYSLNEDHSIDLQLTNTIQIDILEEFRSDFVAMLREKLNNYSIRINPVLKEGKKEKMLYTNKDKFDYLAGKNPSLTNLQKELGLDPEI